MPNKKSKCVNTLEIVYSLEKTELNEFIAQHSGVNKKPIYICLLEEIIRRNEQKEQEFDLDFEEQYLNNWIDKEYDIKLKPHLDYLYPKLIEFVGLSHQESEQSEQQRKMEKLAWQVEGLMQRKLSSHAAMLLKANEEEIKQYYASGYYIHDKSYVERLANLKMTLSSIAKNVLPDFSEDEKAIVEAFRNGAKRIYDKFFADNNNNLFEIGYSGMLYYRLLYLYAKEQKDSELILKTIDKQLEKLEETQQNWSLTPVKNSTIAAPLKFLLLIIKFEKAAQTRNYTALKQAFNNMERLADEAKFEPVSLFYVELLLQRMHLSSPYLQDILPTIDGDYSETINDIPKLESRLKLYTEQLIPDLLARFELNKMILLCYNNRFQEAFDILKDKKWARRDDWKSIQSDLRFLRIICLFEIKKNSSDNSFYEDLNETKSNFSGKKEQYPFEVKALKLMQEGLKLNLKEKQSLLKGSKAESLLEDVKSLQNPLNPLHQLFLWRIQCYLDRI